METKFKFNSQVCTSRSQSDKLLALGLKKETADMVHCYKETTQIGDWFVLPLYNGDNRYTKREIPAWSLHRLLELSPELVKQETPYFTKDGNVELVNGDGIVTKAWGGKSL